MIFPLLLSFIACVAHDNTLAVATETLFAEWSTSPAIPMVMFGLPTDEEKKQVAQLVEVVRSEVIAATASDLPVASRQLEVPFMLGMLDGISMIASTEKVESCLQYLEGLDDACTGLATSRIWRMRLQAALLRGDRDAASKAANSIGEMDEADVEDIVVRTLYEIGLAFEEHDVVAARRLYRTQDEKLVLIGAHHLRNPFASGYARVASIPKETAFGWLALAAWYTEHGVDQPEVDSYLMKQLHRLPDHQLRIALLSKDARIVSLAIRIEVDAYITAGNIEAAAKLLMQLAQSGDIHSAERILSLHEGVGAAFAEEALAIVLAHPTETKVSVEYWYLFAATNEVRDGNYQHALTFLAKIGDDSQYTKRARALEQQLRTIDVTAIIDKIKSAKQWEVSAVAENLVAGSPPRVVKELLRFCIDRCHENGIDQSNWIRPTMLVLLENDKQESPSVSAEAHRLVLRVEQAEVLFQKAMKIHGATIQTTAGLADCQRDMEAMRVVLHNTSPDDSSSYWYWLANLRLIQWFVEEGGEKKAAVAKINRLRLVDELLGGSQFMSQFNAVCQTN